MGRLGSVKPGDGSELAPVTGLQSLWRGQYLTTVQGHEYALDVDFFDAGEKLHLYRDGRQVAMGRTKVAFVLDDLPGDEAAGGVTPAVIDDRPARERTPRIEAAMSLYGMKRAHLVTDAGEQLMTPAPGTGEAWRSQFAERHPTASRVVGALSLAVLLVALGLELPQLLQAFTRADWWQSLTGWTFRSPIELPTQVNIGLTVAGVLAGLERALRMQHNALLDE
ncbi:hypothetical protein [Kytococcus sedentarius]|uniref:hypothetical protein n=1 Tax=Kytococcus sedentarius TaxID=1276 RepID=UPI0035BC8535